MRLSGIAVLGATLALCSFISSAQAHFLWLVAEPAERPTTAKIFFGDLPEEDDPALLERVKAAKVWVAGGHRSQAKEVAIAEKNDILVGELPARSGSSPLIINHTYGVAERAGEKFLLNYYGKAYPSALPGTWEAVNDKERLPLEIVPKLENGETVLEVLWQGKPAAEAQVVIKGPGIEKSLEGTTDAQGVYRAKLDQRGVYAIRARMVEKTAGEHNGKKYDSIRHYTTLALPLSGPQMSPAAHSWPELPKGMTSFGGAVVDDYLYVYGGNFGPAHEVSQDVQSGDLLRLDLKNPQKWEPLPGGTKLTGLAMVAYGGKLYRVGGFTAKNATADDGQDLWSQPEVARFDPAKKAWESLPALPEGRSSHDVAVVGDKLFVVGGWTLKGKDGESVWHNTAWSMDLSQKDLAWKPIASPPFQRRALTLGALGNKLYVIGGMQPDSTTTTAVAIYDPASDKWSEGPSLLGLPMDGFGSSTFACDGSLYVTTMSGSVQRLSADGKAWELVGQLEHPRFFHRLLPWGSKDLVVVGGGHMSVGKVQPLERLSVTSLNSK